MTARTTVTWTITDGEGNPIRRAVVAQLHAGLNGGSVDGLAIVDKVTAVSDLDTGVVTFQLYPNASLDDPEGSHYSFTVDNVSPQVVRYYEVPVSGSTVDLDDLDQLTPSEPPVAIPKASTGNEGDVLTVTSGRYALAAPGASSSVATVGMVIAADAVDGSGDAFSLLVRDAAASASGDIPAGWADAASPVDAAGLASFLTSNFGSGGTNVLVPKLGRVYEVVPANISSAWPRVDATFVDARGYSLWQGLAAVDGTTTIPVDAPSIAFKGTGLLGGADISTVKAAMNRLEGTVDRIRVVAAFNDTTNVDLEDLEHAAFDEGGLLFVDGNGDPVAHCAIWLDAQTTPAENGYYKVYPDFTYEHVTSPGTFTPPGQFGWVIVANAGDPHHGKSRIWLDHDPSVNKRAGQFDTDDAVGAFHVLHDPTATGSGPDLSDDDPEPLGTADPGVSADASRADHVHDLPTSAEVGSGRWFPSPIQAWAAVKAVSSGTLALAQSAGRWFGGYAELQRSTVGGTMDWETPLLDAGTYTLRCFNEVGATLGVCTLALSGPASVAIGTTVNQWAGSTTSAPTPTDITGIVIPTTGIYTLRSEVTAGGNSVSTNASQRWSGFQFIRTA